MATQQTTENGRRPRRALPKDQVVQRLAAPDRSALAKYRDFFVGDAGGLAAVLRYDLFTTLGAAPGAAGYLLRKVLYRRLLGSAGRGILFGRNVALRHPGKIHIGDGAAIDDDCLLDARGAGEGDGQGLRIGRGVLIARGTVLQCKSGPLQIGDECSIGNHCTLSSAGGIRVGRHVLVAGGCYIGGGRYRTELCDTPIMHQQVYSQGPVDIGDDVWLGAGVIVLDGVRIGDGCVVGAGATVRRDLPPNTILVPEIEYSFRQRQPAAAAPPPPEEHLQPARFPAHQESAP